MDKRSTIFGNWRNSFLCLCMRSLCVPWVWHNRKPFGFMVFWNAQEFLLDFCLVMKGHKLIHHSTVSVNWCGLHTLSLSKVKRLFAFLRIVFKPQHYLKWTITKNHSTFWCGIFWNFNPRHNESRQYLHRIHMRSVSLVFGTFCSSVNKGLNVRCVWKHRKMWEKTRLGWNRREWIE